MRLPPLRMQRSLLQSASYNASCLVFSFFCCHPGEPWRLTLSRSRCASVGVMLPPALFRHHLCHQTPSLTLCQRPTWSHPLQRPTSSHSLGRHSKHRRCLLTLPRIACMVEDAQGIGAACLRQQELIPSLQHDACPCRLLTSPMLYATKLFTRTFSFHRHAHFQKQATPPDRRARITKTKTLAERAGTTLPPAYVTRY